MKAEDAGVFTNFIKEEDSPEEGINVRLEDTYEDEVKDVVVFTMLGKQDKMWGNYPIIEVLRSEIDDSADAFAYRLWNGNRFKYFVKQGRYGKLFDPTGIYSEGTIKKRNRRAGKPEWTFTEVTELVFNLYIDFLRTKNGMYLRHAEREV